MIDAAHLRETAIQTGMKTLKQDAMAKASHGLLSYQEAVAVDSE